MLKERVGGGVAPSPLHRSCTMVNLVNDEAFDDMKPKR